MNDKPRVLALLMLGISVFSLAVHANTYGLTGIRPDWSGTAPADGIGIRFRFFVADNESQSLKIMFSDSRLCGTHPNTYLLEYNVYDMGLRYEDWAYTTWPMQGTHVAQEASLRVAIPDYVGEGRTGAHTSCPNMFPRQTYEIDGIDGLWKTDLISQANMNATECSVEMTRGDIVSDLSDWRADGDNLPTGTYRQWNVKVEFDQQTYDMAFAIPDESGRHLCSWETLIFFTEFLHGQGLLRVYFWDFAIKREGSGSWEALHKWRVSHHDGSLDVFGVCKAQHMGIPVIEIGNDPTQTYLPADSIIDISSEESPSVFRVGNTGNVFTDSFFHAQVFVTGNADVAEWIEIPEAVEPGDVVELDPSRCGTYRLSRAACSTLVAGVVSTAPGITLGGNGGGSRALLALVGIIPVKVTNEGGPILPGDLLVTSSTPGRAMRWAEPGPCPCSLVGKALEPMTDERGVILVLLTAH